MNGPQHPHKGFVQAPVPPLDENGVMVSVVGTICFAVASLVMIIARGPLDRSGAGWWIWVGVIGMVLGGVGIWYCRRRTRRQG